MKKIKLNVKGMHCPSCEMLISDSLQELDGVANAKLDHKSGTAEIEFDGSKVKDKTIITTIEKEGYKVIK